MESTWNWIVEEFNPLGLATMASYAANGRFYFETVYHSLEEVLSVLKKPEFNVLPEVQQLISIFNSERERNRKLSELAALESSKMFPVIALEGLDGSGKTTIAKKLTKSLNAASRATPPECLASLRPKFDSHPVQLRRAFYSLGNYIAADEVEMLRYKQAVILDRFWHSTAAYAIANLVREGWGEFRNLPPAGDPVYNWPTDLLKPDVVLFLYVNEPIREKRLLRRTIWTSEEKRLKEDETFRSNLVDAYKRIRDPGLVSIDSNKTKNKVIVEINANIVSLAEMCTTAGEADSQRSQSTSNHGSQTSDGPDM